MAAAAVAAARSKTLKSVFRQSTRFYRCHATTNPGRLPYHRLGTFPFERQHQTRRTLILESATTTPISESVKLSRLSDSDSGNAIAPVWSKGAGSRNKVWIFLMHAGIVEVCLDRAERKNAIGMDMLRGLQRAFKTVKDDASANILMVRSSVPHAFCAGADLKERKKMSESEVHYFANTLRSTFSILEELEIPTLAVIEGVALGGGFELALACDLRICGEDAILGLPETGLAIIPGAGGTQRLPRIAGKSVAKELIYTGRKITGKDASSMGLVNHSVPAGEAHSKALQIAREMNQKGPLALRMAKRAINRGIELDMESALEMEEDCYIRLLNTKDRLEGLAAFAEKRKPRYTGE